MLLEYKAGATRKKLSLDSELKSQGTIIVDINRVNVHSDYDSANVFISESEKTEEPVCVLFWKGYRFETTAKWAHISTSSCEGGILAVLRKGDKIKRLFYNRGNAGAETYEFRGDSIVDITMELIKEKSISFKEIL
jgi:hypothetical protein